MGWLYNEALNSVDVLDEQRVFLSVLHHASCGGLVEQSSILDGLFVQNGVSVNAPSLQIYEAKRNEYVSLQSFKTNERSSDNVWAYENIYLDLDLHEEGAGDLSEEMDKLESIFASGALPAPTMITFTGRGVGVFYCLDRSISNTPASAGAVAYFKDTRRALYALYERVLGAWDCKLRVDNKTTDDARIVRLPLTKNTESKQFCRLIYLNAEDGQVQYGTLSEWKPADFVTPVKVTKRRTANIKEAMERRVEQLFSLVRARNGRMNGMREHTLFICYAALTKFASDKQAEKRLRDLNAEFTKPLKEREVRAVIRSGNKRTYRISDAHILKVLEITEEENKALGIGTGLAKRKAERAETKARNQKARADRSEEIAAYVLEHPDETYKQIAELFSVSESTLRRAIKAHGIRRNAEAAPKGAASLADKSVHFLSEYILKPIRCKEDRTERLDSNLSNKSALESNVARKRFICKVSTHRRVGGAVFAPPSERSELIVAKSSCNNPRERGSPLVDNR